MRKTPRTGIDVHPAVKRHKKGNNTTSVASSSVVSAVQPGSLSTALIDDHPSVASSSVEKPAPSSAALLDKVQKLGHYPRRFKKADTDEQKAENSLAKKISEAWAKLPEATREELQRLKDKCCEDILGKVRQLGHYPQRF